MGSYIPSTSEERQAMLETIGINDIHELFAHVPQEALLSRAAGSAGRAVRAGRGARHAGHGCQKCDL